MPLIDEKDNWDRAEIVGKILTGLAVPIVLAVIAFFLNSQINERSRAAEMTRIAIGILQTSPGEDGYDEPTLELRRWAVEVLRNPSGDHELSESAAQVLSENPFTPGWGGGGVDGWSDFLDGVNQRFSGSEGPWVMQPIEVPTRGECETIVANTGEFEQMTRSLCLTAYPDLTEGSGE